MSATSAIAATLHGSALENERGSCAPPAAGTTAPAGAPHLWQNFAPGASAVPHAAHVAPTRDAPQLEQNFPIEVSPHAEHLTGV